MRPGYQLARSTAHALGVLLAGLRVSGREHLPREAPYIVAANHISMLDPPVVGSVLPVESAFFAKVELFANPLFGALIRGLNAIPVRRGAPDREALESALAALRAGRSLVIFPEGTRDRSARLREARSGLGFLAARSGVPIVPTYVSGTNHFLRALVRRPRIAVAFGPAFWPPAQPLDNGSARRDAYADVGRAWLDALTALESRHRGESGSRS